MEKIIPSTPAKYPVTNDTERRAIEVLRLILSDYVKPNIHEMDKFPNTDGYLEIINENHEPIGKIDVQIKGVSNGVLGEPKYQCSLNFLSYCESCTLPAFLILVDIKNEVAYWLFISRELLKNLKSRIKPDSESISVKIPSKNIIRRGNAEYLIEWQKIIEGYQIKIWYYDAVLEERKNVEKAYNILKEENRLVGLEKTEFQNIHIFLDTLNMYLDSDFSIIKNLYYNSCWKLGIAYNNYLEENLTYLLYPINYNKNDLQIREISEKLKDEIQKESDDYAITTFPLSNPINVRPENYAKELVIKKINKIFDNKLLPLGHISLFREIIFDFIDKYHECLGLEVKNSYTIQEIKYSFYIYLPIWMDEVLTNVNVNLGTHPLFAPFIDPDFLLVQLNHDKRKNVEEKVKERINNNQLNTKKIIIGSKNFPIRLISNFLASDSVSDSMKLDRLYIPSDFSRLVSKFRFIWEFNSPEEVFENVKTFFTEFPNVYDATIDECFPKLKQKINFFNNFDTLVVVVEAHEEYPDINTEPSIECYYLKSDDINPEKEIKFYMKGKEEIPINREMDFKSKILIEGKTYTGVSAHYSVLDYMFQDLPMFNYLYVTLKEKMDNFFHNDE